MNTKLSHWRSETDQEDVLWLWADCPGTATNVLSEIGLRELEEVLLAARHSPPRGLVLISAKPAGFFAGADIKAFEQLTNPAAALEFLQLGQRVFRLLENARFPTLAAIHGYCLGGGLELALACDYRIAADAPDSRIGLPEIRLGIHPGWGGSHRLPRLIGDIPAMGMMLRGSTIAARKALKLGLVDQAPPARQLRNAACRWIVEQPPRHQAPRLRRLPALLRPLLAWQMHRKVEARAPVHHYPAPHALINVWCHHSTDSKEAASVSRLIETETAQNLLRLFQLRKRLKSAATGTCDIQRIHVIGAGVMGADIAAWCALKGFRVALQDSSIPALGQALKRARQLFKRQLREPRLIQAASDRLHPDPGGQAIVNADLVIEAIYEDLDAKSSLFREIEPKIRDDALLCTNTSSLTLESLAGSLAQPDRLLGLHFFNPVGKMPLVEVVHTDSSDQTLIARARQLVMQLDRLPLAVKSSPGFLVNRILMPYLLEAVVLEAEGISPVSIDLAATRFGMPVGPLELADRVGLDICLAVGDVLASHLGHQLPERLRELVGQGHLGRKSDQGFYQWNQRRPDKPRATPAGPEVSSRLIMRLLNESVACLREGIVADADLLDAGIVFGTGFAPFRGGPLHYVEHKGIAGLHADLRALEASQGKRFHPDPGWQQWSNHHVSGTR